MRTKARRDSAKEEKKRKSEGAASSAPAEAEDRTLGLSAGQQALQIWDRSRDGSASLSDDDDAFGTGWSPHDTHWTKNSPVVTALGKKAVEKTEYLIKSVNAMPEFNRAACTAQSFGQNCEVAMCDGFSLYDDEPDGAVSSLLLRSGAIDNLVTRAYSSTSTEVGEFVDKLKKLKLVSVTAQQKSTEMQLQEASNSDYMQFTQIAKRPCLVAAPRVRADVHEMLENFWNGPRGGERDEWVRFLTALKDFLILRNSQVSGLCS